MSEFDTPRSTAQDIWVDHPRGRLFSRVWSPTDSDTGVLPAEPIVLLHDSLGCVELWRDFPAELSAATGRRVIAYDRLGFGRSDPRNDTLNLDFIADEARSYFATVRRHYGFAGFIVLGHSVGGGMAVNCAAQFPDDCKAVITIAAQAFLEDRTVEGIRIAKEQFQDDKQVDRLRRYHGDKACWVLDAWTETWLAPAFADWSLHPVLPKVNCPLLAIHGLHDEYGSTRHPELIGELSNGPARVEIIPDTFHMPHREKPETIVTLVTDFIAALP
ncbi:MAG: alpha/beta hydrolase [Rhodocyclaceae bacterium]|nr:MAG: alpha/beta hydrolase [Rhodocyclaceae bacterium]